MLARFGGEEFALLLPETSLAEAVRFAEKVRALVEETVFIFDDDEIRVTVSLGVAAVDGRPVDALELIKIADQHLYQAKRAGRNRVESDQSRVEFDQSRVESDQSRVESDQNRVESDPNRVESD